MSGQETGVSNNRGPEGVLLEIANVIESKPKNDKTIDRIQGILDDYYLGVSRCM